MGQAGLCRETLAVAKSGQVDIKTKCERMREKVTIQTAKWCGGTAW